MKRKITSLLLALVMVFSLAMPAFAASEGLSNFQKVNTYVDGQFTDVPSNSWFAPTVKGAYEYGLMQGSGRTFSPSSNITIAETLALADRLHSIYHTGTDSFTEGTPWYQVYVDYAIANGIISQGQYSNYTAKATRAQFAIILAAAFPASALPAINDIRPGAIPDVPAGASYASVAYMLYNAGILSGRSNGAFAPDTNIQRSEVATIVVRMADPSQRERFTLAVPATGISLSLTNMQLNAGKTASLTATVTPADATDKTVTWSSSNTAVATVSASGVVTGVSQGTAVITAKTSNGLTATCTVTVKEVPAFSVPLVNHEYGPMTITSYYSSGKYWWSNNITSLVFTSVELSSSKQYKVSMSMQGTTDYSHADVKVYFYDANGRVLDQVWFTQSVSRNVPYNILITKYIDKDVIENAVRIEFYSYSGHVATKGGGSTGSGSGSGSTGTTYKSYSGYPGVPDLGAMFGISPAYTTGSPSSDYTCYFYSASSLTAVGHASDWLTRYDSAVRSCGLYYIGSFTNSDGNPVYTYTNGTYSVAFGVCVVGGKQYAQILVS